MLDHLHCTRYTSPRNARGQVLLLVLLLLTLGSGIFVFNTMSNVSLTATRDNTNALALAQAKAALIGWAASRGDSYNNLSGSNARPGELPCPDTNNDGFDNDGNCSAGRVGRVPWKTLGMPEPKDASGETLWYAVAGPFRRYSASTTAITSDTMGNMTVYSGDNTTTLTTQAIAVIFAPGDSLGSQLRNATTAACSTTGTNIANNLCAANYLESTGGANNAVNNGPFISASDSTTFNDRVLVITAADLMPVVEQRVAREMMSILENYRIATGGDYPWSDRSDGGSNNTWNHNRFPCNPALALPLPWTGALALPLWLQNGCDCTLPGQRAWSCVILYAVAKNKLEFGGAGCNDVCNTSSLTVNNPSSRPADLCLAGAVPFKCTPTVVTSGSANLVLITPGSTTVNRALPIGVAWPNTAFTTITQYFEDAQNGANNSDTYVVPSSTNYDRDRIYIVR